MVEEPLDGGGDHALAQPAALVFAKQVDLVEAGVPPRILLGRMTPDEADQLPCRSLEHQNEMRGVERRKLLAPLPFPRCIGGSRAEGPDVRLVERAHVELGEWPQIADGGLAEHQIADEPRRGMHTRSAEAYLGNPARSS